MTKESIKPGPAYCAPRPESTKIPPPITAPTPKAVSETGPNVRFSVCSPVALASFSSQSIGFFLNSGLLIRNLLSENPGYRPQAGTQVYASADFAPATFHNQYTGTPSKTMIKPGQVYCGL